MAVLTEPDVRAHGERRRYQLEVERHLEQIAAQIRQLRRLEEGGVQGRALVDRKRELERTRKRLATLTSRATVRA